MPLGSDARRTRIGSRMTQPERIGRYEVSAELGRGAMGIVYRGRDPALDRPVAIKLIRLGAVSETVPAAELEARFLREARIAARLHHPRIATIYDAGREGDSLFLVMELVEGESLARRLLRGDFPGSTEALLLVAEVADALAAAHAAGIVHRDVKPANILLGRGGGVKVSDFGVAKAVGESTELTRSGSVLGSPAYMAPEQIQGRDLDGRADVFSLGVVLYELLLRRKPFPADTVTTLIYQILHQDPFADRQAWAGLPAVQTEFLRWCLAKEPVDRVPDARTFAARARELAGVPAAAAAMATADTVLLPDRAAATTVARGPAGTRRAWLTVALAAGLVAIGLGAWWGARQRAVEEAVQVPGGSASPTPSRPAAAAMGSAASPAASRRPVPSPSRRSVPAGSPVVASSPAAGEPPPSTAAEAPASAASVVIDGIFRCRRAAVFKVSPDDTEVAIDGKVLGVADDWDGQGGGKEYVFPHPGTYLVRLTRRGYYTANVQVLVRPDAADDVADVDTELEEQPERR